MVAIHLKMAVVQYECILLIPLKTHERFVLYMIGILHIYIIFYTTNALFSLFTSGKLQQISNIIDAKFTTKKPIEGKLIYSSTNYMKQEET